jgi:hypothetical protein
MLSVHRHIDRMAVATWTAVCLKDGQVAVPVQLMGGIQTRDATADDCYAHVNPPAGLWLHTSAFVADLQPDALSLNQIGARRRMLAATHNGFDGDMPHDCRENEL